MKWIIEEKGRGLGYINSRWLDWRSPKYYTTEKSTIPAEHLITIYLQNAHSQTEKLALPGCQPLPKLWSPGKTPWLLWAGGSMFCMSWPLGWIPCWSATLPVDSFCAIHACARAAQSTWPAKKHKPQTLHQTEQFKQLNYMISMCKLN